MKTFTLKIKLGNAAMQTRDDVARALRAVANRIDTNLHAHPSGVTILDDNGNSVGVWAFK